ncbi:MAG: cytochrome c oxidase subunit II [Candidatus Omnitrophica bacterium]|nr:cytochrome c oxidase subunit II [Candidatus Omnitrophota bacterium]
MSNQQSAISDQQKRPGCWLLAAGCWLLAIFVDALAVPAWAAGPYSYWLPESASTVAPAIDRLFYIILWITGVIFFAVEGLLLFFLVRYRARPGRAAHYTHGNERIEIIWTVIPALILVWLSVASQRLWAQIRDPRRFPANAFTVEVLAEQFAWNIRYAGADGIFGTPDDVTTVNQLHMPVNQPVLVRLSSKDVIHSFFVPVFRLKQDAVPGLTIPVWLQATKTGHYEIACAELCGLGHYRMRGYLTIETLPDVQTWLAQTKAQE